jgi:hypothetical protein
VLQLFIEDELQVLARYPNARWDDKTVFMANEYWLKAAAPGIHNLTTGEGLLRDAGACKNPSDCCRTCNTHDLAKSGIDATGALAIINLWSCDTGVQRITQHTPGMSTMKYNATWVGLCDTYRGGNGRYYLENHKNLLDMDYEWLFDTSSKSILRTAAPPASAKVRGRVSTLAIEIKDSSFATVSNIDFHATSITAGGHISNIKFKSLNFEYPATSRRSLGETVPPVAVSIWSDPPPWVGGNHSIDDVSMKYADGPALLVQGDGSVLSNSAFEWNDWTTVGGSWAVDGANPHHTKANRGTTVRISSGPASAPITFRRLNFRNNGAAQSFNAAGTKTGGAPLVELCDFQSQLAIEDDGSFVEGGGAVSTIYRRNWCTDSGKAGLRWDGYYPDTNLGLMTENVVWNASGVVVKGDNHNVSYNTIFDGADISASKPYHDRPRYQDDASPLGNASIPSVALGAGTKVYNPKANQKTVFIGNIFDSVQIKGKSCPEKVCPLPGQYVNNLVLENKTFDIKCELRDPYHHDFRPCPGGQVATRGLGAYRAAAAGGSETYWIPGRQLYTSATTPIPPDASIAVKTDVDLMFLPMREGSKHSVYLGKDGGTMKLVGTVQGEANIVSPGGLSSNTKYTWRVDAVGRAGQLRKGPEWEFTTGSTKYCPPPPAPTPPTPKPTPPPTPAPAPTPPTPLPASCTACENQYCPGLAGKGQSCEACVEKNSPAFVKAGCWKKTDPSPRHSFLVSWCGI